MTRPMNWGRYQDCFETGELIDSGRMVGNAKGWNKPIWAYEKVMVSLRIVPERYMELWNQGCEKHA